MVNYILLSRSQIIYLFSFSYLDINLVRIVISVNLQKSK
jgi:hypothetical protein